jgi:hypothetical protein
MAGDFCSSGAIISASLALIQGSNKSTATSRAPDAYAIRQISISPRANKL